MRLPSLPNQLSMRSETPSLPPFNRDLYTPTQGGGGSGGTHTPLPATPSMNAMNMNNVNNTIATPGTQRAPASSANIGFQQTPVPGHTPLLPPATARRIDTPAPAPQAVPAAVTPTGTAQLTSVSVPSQATQSQATQSQSQTQTCQQQYQCKQPDGATPTQTPTGNIPNQDIVPSSPSNGTGQDTTPRASASAYVDDARTPTQQQYDASLVPSQQQQPTFQPYQPTGLVAPRQPAHTHAHGAQPNAPPASTFDEDMKPNLEPESNNQSNTSSFQNNTWSSLDPPSSSNTSIFPAPLRLNSAPMTNTSLATNSNTQLDHHTRASSANHLLSPPPPPAMGNTSAPSSALPATPSAPTSTASLGTMPVTPASANASLPLAAPFATPPDDHTGGSMTRNSSMSSTASGNNNGYNNTNFESGYNQFGNNMALHTTPPHASSQGTAYPFSSSSYDESAYTTPHSQQHQPLPYNTPVTPVYASRRLQYSPPSLPVTSPWTSPTYQTGDYSYRATTASSLSTSVGNRPTEPVLQPGEEPASRPPYSYAALIGEALLLAPAPHHLYVSEISEFVKNKYPYYRQNPTKIYNGVRHQTSMCKGFVKLPRPFGDQSGGARKWAIREGCQTWWNGGKYHPPNSAKAKKKTSMHKTKSRSKQLVLGAGRRRPGADSDDDGYGCTPGSGPSSGKPWDATRTPHPFTGMAEPGLVGQTSGMGGMTSIRTPSPPTHHHQHAFAHHSNAPYLRAPHTPHTPAHLLPPFGGGFLPSPSPYNSYGGGLGGGGSAGPSTYNYNYSPAGPSTNPGNHVYNTPHYQPYGDEQWRNPPPPLGLGMNTGAAFDNRSRTASGSTDDSRAHIAPDRDYRIDTDIKHDIPSPQSSPLTEPDE